MKRSKTLPLTLTMLVCATWQSGALACPFCSAVSQTLTQEIAGADVAVIARLIKLPPETDSNGDSAGLNLDDPDSGMAEFEVLETIRGEDIAGGAPAKGSTIQVVYFGSGASDSKEQQKKFLISGIAGKKIDWTTPLPLTERGIEYIKALGSLPEKGAARLAFFLAYLEDEDPLLAQDAYDEFGRAPYEEVIAVGDQIDRPKLIGWIEDSQVGPTRRRLYLTMLGICGQAEDVVFLESLLQYDYQQMKPGLSATLAIMAQNGPAMGVSVLNEMVKADVRRKRQCLDALIAAYLKLKGPAGLPLIEEQFLTNPAAEYTHVYAAVMALRFHGEETDSLPRERLLQTVRLLLNNTDIADQVIPDLARWEDWSVLERLVTMFKDSEEGAWVRQPVISYLLAATEQPAEISERAKAALAELEALDPKGVKRARSYMAFGLLARAGAKKKTAEKTAEKTTEKATEKETANDAPKDNTSVTEEVVTEEEVVAEKTKTEKTNTAVLSAKESATTALVEDKATTTGTNDQEQTTSAAADTQEKVPAEKPVETTPAADALAESAPPAGPSRMVIIGGPLIAGLALFGVFALLLRGADVRSNDS
ncbi:MAG: hypothetical protein GXP24_14450 [Planctomycetes bacterium]|nr:hypothetical protein [Planctomycetota bacterium]